MSFTSSSTMNVRFNYSCIYLETREVELKQRQNKNDSIQSKISPILKLPLFSPYRIVGGEKARQFQS